jgi:RNase P subunit RPR2
MYDGEKIRDYYDMETITKEQKKDIRLLGKFVEVYCAAKHPGADRSAVGLPAELAPRLLCQECASFLEYAVSRRVRCPLEAEKPTCKHCRIHCYDQQRREKVREIMSYVGRRLVMRGRLDYLWHYFF